jgi:predicted PurR-regulated permease PerM
LPPRSPADPSGGCPAGDGHREAQPAPLSARAKLAIIGVLLLLIVVFLLRINQILSPFLWALLAAYLLTPIVNYLNIEGRLPRLWAVALIYASIGLLLLASSRYVFPRLIEQANLFVEDIPRIEASLVAVVGPRPLGIDISRVVDQLVSSVGSSTSNARTAGRLLVNAVETTVKLFLFLVATFYLLMDSPRITRTLRQLIPPDYRPELTALGRQINITWQQYIRGELLLFVLMATITSISLTILGVPGAIFLGLVSGLLELLPLVGPLTAGTLAVSVAYFSGTNPWGWSQVAYAGIVALLYFVLRQTEDYLVIPHVLGRAVRLHPLVVLFALAAGGIIDGLYGLLVAVPIAASIKAISAYLYAKLLDLPVEFEPVRTIGGGLIEITIHETREQPAETGQPEGAGTP